MSITPAVKWVGGKRQLLPLLVEYVPQEYDTYYEPFLGGAAMFLHLNPKKAVLGDANQELINLYWVIKNNVQELIDELQTGKYVNEKETYLSIRLLDRSLEYEKMPAHEKAARFIYMNRTGFNGLYRVNKANQSNVPFGAYNNPQIVNEKNLLALHERFNEQDVTFLHASFDEVLAGINTPGNFVYLDPPYVPLNTSSFVGYTQTNFPASEHEKVARVAKKLDDAGNYVLVSNSASPVVAELYADFHLHAVPVRRNVSAKASARGKTEEFILVGRTLHEKLKSQ